MCKRRDQEGSGFVFLGFFGRLYFDDAVLHVHVKPMGLALRHGNCKFTDTVAVENRCPERLLDGLALEGEERLGGGEDACEAAGRNR